MCCIREVYAYTHIYVHVFIYKGVLKPNFSELHFRSSFSEPAWQPYEDNKKLKQLKVTYETSYPAEKYPELRVDISESHHCEIAPLH